MNQHQAQQLALDLMREHGLLADGWQFQWSRGKRQLGLCHIKRVWDARKLAYVETKMIKLSRYLVALNEEDEVRDTILHEIAHAIAGLKNGHNHAWKRVCRQIGARPERLAGNEVNMPEGRYSVICGQCDRTLQQRHRRPHPRRLRRGYCKVCGPSSSGRLRMEDRMAQGVAA